jgi:hypothetical protein
MCDAGTLAGKTETKQALASEYRFDRASKRSHEKHFQFFGSLPS